jgi:hypothetical protein
MPSWKKVIVSGSDAILNTITGSGGIHLPDHAELRIGDSNDFRFYHDSNHSYIKDAVGGHIRYRAGTQTFQNGAGSKTMAVFNGANSVDLNYNNSTKFQTTNTGVSITGNTLVSGNVSGSASSTGSFGRVQASVIGGNSPLIIEADSFSVDSFGTVSGSSASTGSFGTLANTKIDGVPLYGHNKNHLGIGEATSPGTVDGWSGSGNITILNVKDSNAGARVSIQGLDASLDLVDTGATGDKRWFTIYNQDDMAYMRGLNSAGSAVTHEFISFDLDTGYLGINDDSPSYQLDVAGTGRFTGALTLDSTISNVDTTNVTASGNISGSASSTGSFGRLGLAVGGGVDLPDNVKLNLGDGNDLQIYHGGSNSIIKDAGSGGLILRATELKLIGDNTSEEFIVATENAGVEIYYDDVKKIETTSEGIDISGSLYVSGSYGAGLGAISASGDVVADGDIVAYNSSDERLKDNIEVIQGSLDKIDGIRGVEFDWNEKSPGWARERGHDVGVIAQEVQKVLPEIVVERKNGYLGVDYKRIVPLLIESIKELKQEVNDLKKKVN